MSSSPPPTKPPRGVKQGRETSGLLMSVIRTLSATETNEQREKERAKLEKEYKISDAKLDKLVAEHSTEITEVMQKFSKVSVALNGWGAHSDAVVARLNACQTLLQLRQEDLRRLYLDAKTHHYALQMLTDIECVLVSEREIRDFMSMGRVLGAATTLQNALKTADSSLQQVHALSNTREHLEIKKRELVNMIVKELNNVVFRGDPEPMSRRYSSRRRTALLLAELTKSEEVTFACLQDITPEFEASLTEEDKTFETTVMISLEALGVLEQLKEATEKFRVHMQDELLDIIDTVSKRIIEEGDVDDEVDLEGLCEQDNDIYNCMMMTETGRPLTRLVETLNEEFRACAARNKRLLQVWRAALQRHNIPESCLYTENHFWSAVQQVLQLVLTEYLEIESVTLAAERGGSQNNTPAQIPLNEYFAKKRPQRRTEKLFKFAVGTSPVTRSTQCTSRTQVCTPHPSLLYRVLPAIHNLCTHIEDNIGVSECSLRSFLWEYIRGGETERLGREARRRVEDATAGPTAWRARVRPTVSINNLTAPRVIFSCVGVAVGVVREVCVWSVLAGRGPARGVFPPLSDLAARVSQHHHHLAPHTPHTSRAARWLADDDIVRFLQSLPNWRAATSPESVNEDKQFAQELKQAYEREAEILGSSLGDGAVSRREIVADLSTLSDLAVMCESMEWISANVRQIPSFLTSVVGPCGPVKLTDKFVNDINSAALIFDDIAHKCLLFLHLEMRIQCFYYLSEEEASDTCEGGGAARLAHALHAAHELAANVLHPKRTQYIFNGIGEMMSAGVIWRCQSPTGISGGANVARLAALRHCLASLQLPNTGLQTAHNYLHMLNCTPEEIITSIHEKGPQFSELEYLNAFKVIESKRGYSPTDMKKYLKELSTALGHLGVTV